MLLRLSFSVISLLSTLFFFACQLPPPQTSAIRDVLQPLQLIAGKTDTIVLSDLFFAQNYEVTFEPHPMLSTKVDTISKKLVITPGETAEGLTLLSFRHGNGTYKLPVSIKRLEKIKLIYTPTEQASQVFVMGSFNSWNRLDLPMQWVNGKFERELLLEPGRYEYKFVIDGKEILDPVQSLKLPNGLGGFNSILDVSSPNSKPLFLHAIYSKEQIEITELHFILEGDSSKIMASEVIALAGNQSIPPQQMLFIDNRLVLILKQDNLVGERLIRVAISKKGNSTPIQTVRLLNGKVMGSKEQTSPFASQNIVKPFSWNDAIIYSILIDRFFNGDSTNDNPLYRDSLFKPANWQGGDLKGIIDKLDEGYFDSLGVNVLWLSPVNKAAMSVHKEYPPPHRYYTGYHGYWTVHHEEVEPRFGTMQDLKRLVAKAHSRGMKVLLDFVANHTHIDHPFYQQHPEWFGTFMLPNGKKNIRLWDEHRLTTWFEPFLPSFDYRNPVALDTMTSNAIWWLKESRIDGFRHDAVKHVPNEFWRELTRKIKSEIEIPEKRKIYQIGETFGSYDLVKSYVNMGQLDGQFNFSLYDAAIFAFAAPEGDFTMLDKELRRTQQIFGTSHLMGNIMDSHDKVRFMAFAERDILFNEDAALRAWINPPKVDEKESYQKLKLYQTYLHTIPGLPVIYYGDEIGMTGASDPDNRRAMRFSGELNEDEKKAFADISKLVKFRREHTALRYGDFQSLLVTKDIIAYLRSDLSERILVSINKSKKAETITLKFPSFYYAKKARDLHTGKEFIVTGDSLQFSHDPLSAWVLKIE